jgi:hypothetical protein
MSHLLSINTDSTVLAEQVDPSSNQSATIQGGLTQFLSGWMANTEGTHGSVTLTGLSLVVQMREQAKD